jgi:hypothetical protein
MDAFVPVACGRGVGLGLYLAGPGILSRGLIEVAVYSYPYSHNTPSGGSVRIAD